MARLCFWISLMIFVTGAILLLVNELLDLNLQHVLLPISSRPTETRVASKRKYIDSGKVTPPVKSHITQWQQEPWVPIDSKRFFMHHVAENGNLEGRQSCAMESVAKHNPDRQVHILMPLPPNWSKDDYLVRRDYFSPWWRVVQRYPNLQVVLYDEKNYFKNTSLFRWYENGTWKNSPNNKTHLADYTTVASLFRGGGLFFNLNSGIALKPLQPSKFWNFFVKRGRTSTVSQNNVAPAVLLMPDMMHLVFQHHLSDEMILKMSGYDYDPLAAPHEPLITAISTSLNDLCNRGENGYNNQCLDIRLYDENQVFLPPFNSTFWHKTLTALKKIQSSVAPEKNKITSLIISNAIATQEGAVIKWSAIDYPAKSSYNSLLYSTLLAQNCPFTVAHFPTI